MTIETNCRSVTNTSIRRRSFLKYCAAGSAGLLVSSSGLMACFQAQSASLEQRARTLCGCFNLPSAEMGRAIGAQATRLIFRAENLDQQIAAARGGDLPKNFQLVKNLASAGIPVTVTFSWISNRARNLPEPGSAEWQQWLATARNFVRVMGPYLACVTLENEPITSYRLSEFVPRRAGDAPAIEWFKALAATLRQTAPHLLISSPALNILWGVIDNSHPQWIKPVATFFEWVRKDFNIDVIDVHAHVDGIATMKTVLAYAASQFTRGIVMTEWSQARSCKQWDLLKIDAGFAAKWNRSHSLTNQGYIAQCESNPAAGSGDSRVSLAEWNDFVATAPIDPNFMRDSFNAIRNYGVRMAAYGAAIQYGSPLFDIKDLYANLTMVPGPDGNPQPNYKFLQWFQAMAATA